LAWQPYGNWFKSALKTSVKFQIKVSAQVLRATNADSSEFDVPQTELQSIWKIRFHANAPAAETKNGAQSNQKNVGAGRATVNLSVCGSRKPFSQLFDAVVSFQRISA
jgi:hypothetical protein